MLFYHSAAIPEYTNHFFNLDVAGVVWYAVIGNNLDI